MRSQSALKKDCSTCRSGSTEAIAGGVKGFQLSAKLTNSIGQSSALEATYAPIQLATVRAVDAARKAGRAALRRTERE